MPHLPSFNIKGEPPNSKPHKIKYKRITGLSVNSVKIYMDKKLNFTIHHNLLLSDNKEPEKE
ncbi:hypothetical protein FACS1894166_11180 [Bacilli bacterium]|nr:hypothetical protein FACS1894166_11180 [Bacilli bacterium]